MEFLSPIGDTVDSAAEVAAFEADYFAAHTAEVAAAQANGVAPENVPQEVSTEAVDHADEADEADDDTPLRVRPSWGAALSQLPGLPTFEISFADLGSSAARVVSFSTSGDVEEREVIYRGDVRRAARRRPFHVAAADSQDDSYGAHEAADYPEDQEDDADEAEQDADIDDGFDDVPPAREQERRLRY
jgi:hypothetical protein